MDLVTINDISAAVSGGSWAYAYGNKPLMQALQSFVISVIARMAAKSEMAAKLDIVPTKSKNELIVAILSAGAAYWRNGSVLKGALSGYAIDLISEDVVNSLGLSDSPLISTSGAKGPASATTSGSSGP